MKDNNLSPSETYSLPVIGSIRCHLPIEGYDKVIDVFEVIQIKEVNGQKIYICNQWNSPDKPQLVHSSLVLEFILKA